MGRAVLAALAACIVACRSTRATPDEPSPAAADGPRADATAPGPSSPNAIGMPSASIAAVINPANLPPYTGPTVAVEGTVLVRGPDSPDVPNLDVKSCPAALDAYGKLFRAGPPRPDGARPLADAVVVVTGYHGFYLPERDEAQKVTIRPSCAYPTRAIALTFGQRLEIANDSPIAFAPYIEGASQISVMIAAPYQRGEPVKIFPPRADHFALRDQLQKFVRGDVYVLRQPLHAVSDTDGRFRIEGVPVGKLQVAAHSAALNSDAISPVDVTPNGAPSVELQFTYSPREPARPSAPGGGKRD